MKLDEKGRCPECAIKPLVYKKAHGPGHPRQKFCHRCCRSYDLETGQQQANWAWKIDAGSGFISTVPSRT